jgi:nitrogen fixation NifU-like protein
MSDLRDLYQEVILDHYKHPRNFRRPDSANRQAEGNNPLCGDQVQVFIHLEGDVVREVGFKGSGCAISTASASLMTEALEGKTRQEAEALFQRFRGLMTGEAAEDWTELGKLEVLAGVREFPIRVKCATLAWHTFRAALENSQEAVSTE